MFNKAYLKKRKQGPSEDLNKPTDGRLHSFNFLKFSFRKI